MVEQMIGVSAVLTISRLKARSMAYYNGTSRAAMNAAADRQRAGGGLGECYSESECRHHEVPINKAHCARQDCSVYPVAPTPGKA